MSDIEKQAEKHARKIVWDTDAARVSIKNTGGNMQTITVTAPAKFFDAVREWVKKIK